MNYQPIENHGIVGDLRTTAIIDLQAAVSFMCYPDFDSPTVFASLLDAEKGGSFRITPLLEDSHSKQLYLPDSNILLTRFLSNQGVAEVSDYMTMGTALAGRCLVRRVKAVRHGIQFTMQCAPRFNYGRTRHRAIHHGNTVFFQPASDHDLVLALRSSVPLSVHADDARADFQLHEGESAHFVLQQAHATQRPLPLERHLLSQSFKETLNFWRRWIAQSQYRGRWRGIVDRSALVLKLLTAGQHGSLLAAATFGLPEEIGGERNWDYRYSWIRDSAFTLNALLQLGFTDEAGAFVHWLQHVCKQPGPTAPVQIMYSADGRTDLTEYSLDHFEGYRRSRPVRVGNAAAEQLQLDIFGELLDALHLYDRHGSPLTFDAWTHIAGLVDWVADHWQQPDDGIWEVRGGRQHFLSSRVMCWVALDRALRLARRRGFPAPVARWRQARKAIHDEVHRDFWDPKLQAFVQYKGAKTVDAAALLMPLVRFIDPQNSRWFFTLRRIEQVLVADSLLFRYDPAVAADDGLRGEEGTFTMCSFWYVECIARAGDLHKARFLFEKALSYANHLGLYAEQLGPRGEHLGNFPQAFTHLALISAACYLNQHLPKSE